LKTYIGPKANFIENTVFRDWLNITDFKPTDIQFLVSSNVTTDTESFIGHMVSDRAILGWATHGVSLFSLGKLLKMSI
jgi:alkaline phosphatase